jgi:hypothetical protein
MHRIAFAEAHFDVEISGKLSVDVLVEIKNLIHLGPLPLAFSQKV